MTNKQTFCKKLENLKKKDRSAYEYVNAQLGTSFVSGVKRNIDDVPEIELKIIERHIDSLLQKRH